MVLFNIENSLKLIKEKPFHLEKELQELTENNLKVIFGLNFVKSEFALNNLRIDTLAFDIDANAFVIIEYKRNRNFSVVDQGVAYLSLMLNNKADFILEYNETQNKTLKRNDVDWSQSRVLFISTSFTKYQREAINFKDLSIELWEVKRFENNTISYEQIEKIKSIESIKTISKTDKTIKKVSKEIKLYSEEDFFINVNDEIIGLYEKLKNSILGFDNIKIIPRKKYIAFVSARNVVDISLQRKTLKIWINLRIGELDDPKNLSRNVSQIGHFGNGDYELLISSDEDFEYILSLIKQSVKKNKK